MKEIFAAVLLLVFCVGMVIYRYQNSRNEIYEWAKTNNYEVISIEYPWIFDPYCPFWRYKNDDVRKVKYTYTNLNAVVNHTVYFRFNIFSTEVEKAIHD
jgi:hypothetical protein